MTQAPRLLAAEPALSRRAALVSALGAGLGAAFLGAGARADSPSRPLMVVIIARGAMDGLSLVPPVGDPDYQPLRQALAIPAAEALGVDSTFSLHPKLKTLYAMQQAGQARLAPAVAIPERIRSHFEAQDLLETGGARLYAASTGWLNRALEANGGRSLRGLSIGPQEPLILRGPVQAESWSPGGAVTPDAQRLAAALGDLYAEDALLGPALAEGLRVERQAEGMADAKALEAKDAHAFAGAAARFLTAPDGPSIAVLSLAGFDTHARQGGAEGQLANRFATLDAVLDGLRQGLGDRWSRTVMVVATEFGRTARVNGTGGTDHGTASALILAGGALRPGGILGDWPTLAQARLYENRDLAPTLDIRSVFKGVLRDHMGIDRRALETVVFPNSADARPVLGLTA